MVEDATISPTEHDFPVDLIVPSGSSAPRRNRAVRSGFSRTNSIWRSERQFRSSGISDPALRTIAGMLQRLGPADREEIVDVLAGAFADYPVMRYVLSATEVDYGDALRTLVGLFVDLRLDRGSPVLGVRSGGDLVAAALIDEPDPKPVPSSPLDPEGDVWAVLGAEANRRMTAFEEESAYLEPDLPHYFVGMIGVRAAQRGKGLARRLLGEVERMSVRDPRSRAVSLSTEQESNLGFYERLGYRVTGEAQLGELHTWNLMLETT